jgi:ankyrin repeat protein
MAAASASSEGATTRPVLTYEDAQAMIFAKCSLEAFQERMLSSEFNVARDGESVYNVANKPIRAWLRSLDFAARVGAIEWRDPLKVFFDACKEGDEEYVSRLAKEHPEWLDATELHTKASFLHSACAGGLIRLLPVLLSRGAQVNGPDRFGFTPLFRACEGGHLEVFQFMLDQGATVEVENPVRRTMLHAACEGGNPAIVKALLDMGLDANAANSAGETALFAACRVCPFDAVSLLVEHGADVEVVSPRGSPLHAACRRGDLEIVKLFCRRGASLKSVDVDLLTPLGVAMAGGHVGVAKYLISEGASLEELTEKRWVIEGGVILHDHVPGMKFLLQHGVTELSKELLQRCLGFGHGDRKVLRFLLLHSQCTDDHVVGLGTAALPPGWLGDFSTLVDWRKHELRMELRYLMLSWRRGFVVSRLEG